MAVDPVGATLGVLGLFGTCMQFFDRIQYGGKLGASVEEFDLKMALARLQLTRWAESVGLCTDATGDEMPRDTTLARLDAEQSQTVYRLLGQIHGAFQKAEELSRKYATKHPNPADSETIDPADDLTTIMGKLAFTAKKQSRARHKSSNLLDKLRFALYERNKFVGLTNIISESVQDLLEVFPASVMARYKALAGQDATELAGQDRYAMQLLKDNAEDQDDVLEEAAEHALTVMGTKWDNVTINGSTRTWLGHDVAYGTRKQSDTYSNLTISGEAWVHAGSVFRGKSEGQTIASNSFTQGTPQSWHPRQFSQFPGHGDRRR